MNQEQQLLVQRLDEAGLSLRRFLKVGPDKAAFEANWDEHLYTPDELNGSPAWGVVGKDGLVLIDSDNYEMAELLRSTLPETFEAISPRRQLPHFYFSVDGGDVPNRVLKLPGKADGSGEIRAQNQYLVAPGSVVEWGTYGILQDKPIAKLQYPDFMGKITPLLGEDADQRLNKDKMRDGVESGTRHHYGIRMATYLIAVQKLDRASAIHSMEEWNTKNNPPMALYDLTRMVDYAIGKHGESTPPGPIELGGGVPGTELTDKLITDYILGKHSFYCDVLDPNLVLYTWQGGFWQRGIYKGVIKKELGKIFVEEESRMKLQLEKIMTFIDGVSMENSVQPAPTHKISFKNGLLDIKTMVLGEHDKNLFIVNQIPHDYDSSAKCPKWLEWVGETVPLEDVLYLQEWMGYHFYPLITEAAFTVCTGSGANGKTIMMDLLLEIIGMKNNTDISLPALSYDTFSRAELDQKLSNISDDLGNTVIKTSGWLKKASSGSMINAQHKFGHPFDFKPYAKITYACNEPPEIKDQSEAIKIRLRVVRFPNVFTKEPKGKEKLARNREELMSELRAEIPGVINWMLEGLLRFLENNSTFTVSMGTEETWKFYYRKSMPVIAFSEECLDPADDDTHKMTIDKMYEHLLHWLDVNEIDLKIGKRKMIADLKEVGIATQRKRADNQKYLYYGLVCPCAMKNTNYVAGNNKDRSIGVNSSQHRGTLDDFGPIQEGEEYA